MVLIRLADGISYAVILKCLKKWVKPEELGITVQGIRKTLCKDLLVKLKCSKEDRRWLYFTFKEVISASGSARHLIPRIEVEIADIDPSIDAEDVGKAVRGFFDWGSGLELKVPLTGRPIRGNIKACVCLEETWVIKLLKATLIGIGWASCSVRRKTVADRCYRCLGFCHMVENCRGRDRSRSC